MTIARRSVVSDVDTFPNPHHLDADNALSRRTRFQKYVHHPVLSDLIRPNPIHLTPCICVSSAVSNGRLTDAVQSMQYAWMDPKPRGSWGSKLSIRLWKLKS